MADKSWGKILLIVGAVLVLGYFIIPSFQVWVDGLADGIAPVSTQVSTTATPYISTGATDLSFIGADALELGTSVKLTTQVSTNDGAFSSSVTSGSPGDMVDLLFTNTSYHSVYSPDVKVETAPTQTFNVNLLKNASATLSLFNNNGDKMEDTGGNTLVNQTVSSGGAYNLKLRIDGEDKKSTNPMRCVLEASNGTAMKTMSLSGFGAVFIDKAKPSSYTLAGSDSEIWIYDIDAVQGAVSPEGTVAIVSESGMSLGTTGLTSFIKIDCYSKEYFIDTNTGKVTQLAIEDSLGTLKSLAHYQVVGNLTSG